MSGVTHFERRDRARRNYATCGFACGKKIKATPRQLAGDKRGEWERKWIVHLRDHLCNPPKDWGTPIDHIETALRTAMEVAVESDRNR